MSPLKFFRQYEKWLVSIGMTFLMILFLIEPTLQMMRPDLEKMEIGKTRTRKITTGDQRRANMDVELLPRISPLLDTGLDRKGDSLTWALMLQDAEEMGISASEAEVDLLLPVLGFKGASLDADLARVAASQGLKVADIVNTLRHWLIIQNYRELQLGLGHVSTSQRAQIIGDVAQYMKPEYMQNPMMRNFLMQQVMGIMETAKGTPRLSLPIVRKFLYDVRSEVKISALPISAERYAGTIGNVDEKKLADMFEKYKKNFAGSSEPFGFGYKQPAWVRLEYLSIPFDRLLGKVTIEEADALAYYDGHMDQFTITPPAATEPAGTQPATQPAPKPRQQTYDEVRQRIIVQLRTQKAVELLQAVNKTAMAIFAEEARSLPEDAGYRNIPAEFKPIPLTTVADKLQKQHGVRADVVRLDDKNLDRAALAKLPGIGQSTLGQDVPFVNYVLSARELEMGENNLTTLRLQKGLASQALLGADRTLYMFRIIDAQPVRVPQTLAEVRAQVEKDAKLLAGYQLLLEAKQTWTNRLNKEGIDALASELGVKVLTPPPFVRRDLGRGSLEAPLIAGIGRSTAFVDAVFAIASQASEAAANQPGKPQDRLAVIPLDHSLTLYLVHIEQFKPMTQSQFDTSMNSFNMFAPQIQSKLIPTKVNPFSTKAVEERVGFVPAAGRKPVNATTEQSEPSDGNEPLDQPLSLPDDAM